MSFSTYPCKNVLGGVAALLVSCTALAAAPEACKSLPDHASLKQALDKAVQDETSGLNLHMWATLVGRDGSVCAVAYSGRDAGSQWLGSRVISAQKANTANAFSLDAGSASRGSGAPTGLALATANLFSAVQPGGSLFGLQHSNPVDPQVAYRGQSADFGASSDPMVGGRIGGVNVFGGGLPLYAKGAVLRGAVGVSGDTSCADHRIAWRLRHVLELDFLKGVGGVSGDPERPDNIVYLAKGEAPNGFKHPECGGGDTPSSLPVVR